MMKQMKILLVTSIKLNKGFDFCKMRRYVKQESKSEFLLNYKENLFQNSNSTIGYDSALKGINVSGAIPDEFGNLSQLKIL